MATDEVCHNDEPEVIVDDWKDSLQFPDSDDEYISNQAEGEGPPQVSSEKPRELDEQAALDETGEAAQHGSYPASGIDTRRICTGEHCGYYPGIRLAF